MNSNAIAALMQLTEHPAQVGRWCGYTKLTDDLHGKWLRMMINGNDDLTIQAHRGSYKTSCLCVAIAIIMITQSKKNIIFLRKSDQDVVEVVRKVKSLIESDVMRDITELIYGDPVCVTRTNATELTVDNYAGISGAAQLIGIGTGGSITGKHADIVITDDIVNVKDRTSRAERERIKLIYQELQNIRNRGGRIINTGTPWHVNDAFSIMPPAQKWDCYQTGLIGAAKLDEIRRSMSPSLFAANYELRHIAEENALFSDAPRFTDDANLIRNGIAHIDAAYGGEDYTAMTCMKRIGGRMIGYGKIWHGHVDTCIDSAIAKANELMCAPFYCENNGDKGYLAKEIRMRGYPCKDYGERQNKYYKISTFLRKWWNKIEWLRDTDPAYIAQIMDYTDDAEHDDAPDSAACCCRILDRTERQSLI